jgi:RNase P subunit RPR2
MDGWLQVECYWTKQAWYVPEEMGTKVQIWVPDGIQATICRRCRTLTDYEVDARTDLPIRRSELSIYGKHHLQGLYVKVIG